MELKKLAIYLLTLSLLQACNSVNDQKEIDGDPIPPEPDEKLNNSTVAGIDSDNDGLRDDVERLINELGDTYNRRMAWKQYFRIEQLILLEMEKGNKEEVVKLIYKESLATECVYEFYEDVLDGSKISKKIEARLLNTKERILLYARADQAFAGKSVVSSDNRREQCDFLIQENKK